MMKLSEEMRSYETGELDRWAVKVAQLEEDLERHEGQIRHYPDSYLGKIFFQGVECGRKQLKLEEENKKLSQAVNDKDQELFESQELVADLLEALQAIMVMFPDICTGADMCADPHTLSTITKATEAIRKASQ